MLKLFENWRRFVKEEEEIDLAKQKAFFIVGSAGSGKSSVVRTLQLKELGFNIVNSDDEFERLLDKYAISKDIENLPPDLKSKQASLAYQARQTTADRREELLADDKGLVIDTTGSSIASIRNQKHDLDDLGYDVFMIFVDVPLEIAKKRNIHRAEEGGRRLPDAAVEKSWEQSHRNLEAFQEMFGNLFYLIDTSSPDYSAMVEELKDGIYRFIKGQE